MSKSVPAFVIPTTQPTELYLNAVAIIADAIELNEQAQSNAQLHLEYLAQNGKALAKKLQLLEMMFLEQYEAYPKPKLTAMPTSLRDKNEKA